MTFRGFIHKHATDESKPLPPKFWIIDTYKFPDCTTLQKICMYLRRAQKVSNRCFSYLFFTFPRTRYLNMPIELCPLAVGDDRSLKTNKKQQQKNKPKPILLACIGLPSSR